MPTHTFADAEAEGADSSDEETRTEEDKVDNDLAAIFDLEDLDLDSEGPAASSGAGSRRQSIPAPLPAKRMGIQTGYDPLSLLAAESECEVAEVSSEGGGGGCGGQSPPGVRRDLAEEIEMYMNHLGSPLSSRAPSSVDLRSPASPAGGVHQHETRRGSLPHCSSRALSVPRSHTYHSHQQVAHSLHSSHAPQHPRTPQVNTPSHARARLWSSPAYPPDAAPQRGDERDRDPHSGMASPSPSPSPYSSSFGLDTLLTPSLDVFKSSVVSASKGVAEKASRWYSRLATYTTPTKVLHTHTHSYRSTVMHITATNKLLFLLCDIDKH